MPFPYVFPFYFEDVIVETVDLTLQAHTSDLTLKVET